MTATIDGKALTHTAQLLPAVLADEHRLQFTGRGRNGYDMDEVDHTMDLVADRIAELMRDVDRLTRERDEARRARERRTIPEGGPLTAAEHEVLDLLARAWIVLATEVVADGSARGTDLSELVVPMHTVQNAVLAQAAARAYPDMYRTLGLSLAEWVEAQP